MAYGNTRHYTVNCQRQGQQDLMEEYGIEMMEDAMDEYWSRYSYTTR